MNQTPTPKQLLEAIKEARDFIEWEPDDDTDKQTCEERQILLDTLCDILREAGVDPPLD